MLMPPNKAFGFTIGADPEFNLCLLEKRVHAQETIRTACEGKLPHGSMGYNINGAGNIGWDGCSATAEIRPDHSDNPYKVAENIRKLITAVYEKMPMMDLITTNEMAPVGGHIHLTIPDMSTRNASSEKINTMVKKLDTMVLPLLMSENKMSEKIRRRNNHYGKLGDIHTDPVIVKGKEIVKVEYRTLNAEWIINPKICSAVLSYMSVCWHEILYHPRNFSKIKDIIINSDETREGISNLMLGNYPFSLKPLIEKIRKFIKTFERYPDFQEEIDYIFNSKKILKEKEQSNFNAAIGWGLRIQQKLTSLIVKNCEKIATKLMSENNMEIFKVEKVINFNDDLNCRNFATKLAALMVFGHVELNNKYSIFGLRKGVSQPIIFQDKKGFISGLDQCKSNTDFEKIGELFYRMSGNLTYNSIVVKKKDASHIIIGLPYEMRVKDKFRDFVKIIYDIEKEKNLKTTTISDYKKSRKEPSNLPSAINNLYQNDEALRFDTSSQGYGFSQDAIRQIVIEENSTPEEEEEEEEEADTSRLSSGERLAEAIDRGSIPINPDYRPFVAPGQIMASGIDCAIEPNSSND